MLSLEGVLILANELSRLENIEARFLAYEQRWYFWSES